MLKIIYISPHSMENTLLHPSFPCYSYKYNILIGLSIVNSTQFISYVKRNKNFCVLLQMLATPFPCNGWEELVTEYIFALLYEVAVKLKLGKVKMTFTVN